MKGRKDFKDVPQSQSVTSKLIKESESNFKRLRFTNHPNFVSPEMKSVRPELRAVKAAGIALKDELSKTREIQFPILKTLIDELFDSYFKELCCDIRVKSKPAIEWKISATEAGDAMLAWGLLQLEADNTDDQQRFAQRLVEPLAGEIGILYGLYETTQKRKSIILFIPRINNLAEEHFKKARKNFEKNRFFYLSWEDQSEGACALVAGEADISSKADIQRSTAKIVVDRFQKREECEKEIFDSSISSPTLKSLFF